MKKSVVIINYGMGNVDSVKRAVEECGGRAVISHEKSDLGSATHIILPGVGNFQQGMDNLESGHLSSTLQEIVLDGKRPFLGICLGMQLLARKGWEGGERKGLGWIEGEVLKLFSSEKKFRIPHIGWNEVIFEGKNQLFKGIPSGKDFYFVHSYHFVGCNREEIIGYTPYCGSFISAVNRENIFGVQFHPEKSQNDGFQVIKNFLDIGE